MLALRPFDKACEKGRKAGDRLFMESIDSGSFCAPGRAHIGAWEKGVRFRKGRARKTKVKRASSGGLGVGYVLGFASVDSGRALK